MKNLVLIIFICSINFIINAQEVANDISEQAKEAQATSIGTQTYIYGVALMTNHYFRNRMQQTINASKAGKSVLKFSENANNGMQLNELVHVQNLTTHEAKSGTSPNEDTFYSVLFLELKNQPQVLIVPPIKNRYFSVQIADAYLENQPYICSRLGDINGGKYVFVGPDWKGKIPTDLKQIKMPHNNGTVVIRILISDKVTDADNVIAIQNQFKLHSLALEKGEISEDKLENMPVLPKPQGLDWYTILLEIMRENPPLQRDEMILRQMESIGLKIDGTTQVQNLDESIKKGLLTGIENGKKIVDWKIKEGRQKTSTNWMYSYDVGKLGSDYLLRASWAVQGLMVNDKEEAMYINGFYDKNGERLDGKNKYIIRIPKDKVAPVNSFWSITSYDDNFDFVPNPYFHYSVGDRQEGGVMKNSDGSVTIYLQNDPPPNGLKNWVPTPKSGNFKVNFRFYNPKEFLFNEDILEAYLPPIEKVKNPIE